MDILLLKQKPKFLDMKKENNCHVRMLIFTKTKFSDTERDFFQSTLATLHLSNKLLKAWYDSYYKSNHILRSIKITTALDELKSDQWPQ